METLQVALGRRSYPIYIGGGLLERAEELLRPLGDGRWATSATIRWQPCTGAPVARLHRLAAGDPSRRGRAPSRWRSTTACAAGWCSWA